MPSFDPNLELDRPDLNKCPDCRCFFPGDNCPLCGKECPPEMRAGARKPPKKKKERGGRETVYFVAWYHSLWVIIPALFFIPVIGIILLLTSPYQKRTKIIVGVCALLWFLLRSGVLGYACSLYDYYRPPVAAGISEDEYRSRCVREDPETLARTCDGREKEFVAVTLTVTAKTTDQTEHSKYDTIYICTDEQSEIRFLVRDCKEAVGGGEGLLPGDTVTVYGQIESAWYTLYDGSPEPVAAPCIAMAYSDRIP